jgi:hypothetical protein
MCHGRKTEYLDIPLKDNIKGWRLEWFIVENHSKSLPPRSGRQPDVRTPSWVESPTALEVTEARILLAEICLLKERGLTTEAVVADFVFKNIQPLKDRAYPAYLYSGITDSTRVTDRKIPTEDLVSQLDMILRGKVSNVGAPVAYSAWNLPPPRSFFNFVSNPPASDSGLGLRVRPSPEDIEALVAPLRDLPNDERQVHFEMLPSPDDVEIDDVLNMLAGESSDSAPAEPMAVTVGQGVNKIVDTRNPKGTCPKHPRQVSRPTAPVEKKKRLRRLSCLDQDVGPSILVCEEVSEEVLPEVDPNGGVRVEADPNGCDHAPTVPNGCDLVEAEPNGCNRAEAEPNGCGCAEVEPNGCDRAEAKPNGCVRAPAIVRIFYEDEEEEEEVPLIRKNNRRYRGSRGDTDIPSPALSALVSLQELSIAVFDRALEDVVPEDMLSEPTVGDMMDVCSEIPDMGLEVSRAVSRASSTLEGSLRYQEVGQDCPTPMEVTEDPSALEVDVAENPAPEGGAGSYPAPEGVVSSDPALVGSESCNPALKGIAGNDPALVGGASYNPAPEGVQVSSPSHTSMDVHVGSLKGKCALGPFLSILVIECQHKCLNVNQCPWMNKVQI